MILFYIYHTLCRIDKIKKVKDASDNRVINTLESNKAFFLKKNINPN